MLGIVFGCFLVVDILKVLWIKVKLECTNTQANINVRNQGAEYRIHS